MLSSPKIAQAFMLGELNRRAPAVVLMITLTTIILGLSLSFSPVYAQRATPEPADERATPVPPVPTPVIIVIEEPVSVGETSDNGGLDQITEAITIEDSISATDPINETIEIEDQVHVEPGVAPERQRAATREKKSRDAFSRGTGSIKENGEGSDNGSLGKAKSAGSGWMVVAYVVIGLAATALLGLLGWRLRRRMQD